MKEWEKIYDILKNEIVNNKYINEKFLPTEQQLCIKFKVSRETIRKVYSKLENEGIVISIKNKGRIKKQVIENSILYSFRNLTNNVYRSEYKIIENNKDKLLIEVKRYDKNNKIGIYAISKIYKEYLDEFFIDEHMLNTKGIMYLLNKYSIYGLANASKIFYINKTEEFINKKILKSDFSILNNCVVYDKYENVIEHSLNYYNPDFFEYKIHEKYINK